jgi:hypothetical protein
MIKEQVIQEFIEEMTEGGLEAIKADGGATPTLIFLTEKEGITEHQPMFIPEEMMGSQEGKTFLAEFVIPKIKAGLKGDGYDLLAIAFISEVWKYKMPEGFNIDEQIEGDYREKCEEKTEQLAFTFHLDGKQVNYMYPMLRNTDEELIGFGDREVLEVSYEDVGGTFGKLY